MSDNIQPRVESPSSYYNFYNLTDNSLFLSYKDNSTEGHSFSNSTLTINDESWKITTQINTDAIYNKPYHVFLILVNSDGSGECVEEKIYDNEAAAIKLQEFTFNFENTSFYKKKSFIIYMDYWVEGTTSEESEGYKKGQTFEANTFSYEIQHPEKFPVLTNTLYKNQIQISCSTPDSQIYYTLDNSTPDSSKSLYSNQFEVESGTTIKAIAIKDGYIDSDIAEYVVN